MLGLLDTIWQTTVATLRDVTPIVAILLATVGTAWTLSTAAGGRVELLLSGLLLLAIGHRLEHVAEFSIGVPLVTCGAMALAATTDFSNALILPLVSHGLFIIWHVAGRWSSRTQVDSIRAWQPGALLGQLLHGMLGVSGRLPVRKQRARRRKRRGAASAGDALDSHRSLLRWCG